MNYTDRLIGNWSKSTYKNVTFENHSTACVYSIEVEQHEFINGKWEQRKQELWLDECSFNNMLTVIEQLKSK